MKKIMAIILAMLMLLTMAACGAGGTTATPSTGEPKEAPSTGESVLDKGTEATTSVADAEFEMPAASELPRIKIGAMGAYSGNELYVQWRKNLESLAEAFNIEFQFYEATTGEDPAAVVENLATAGCQAIMTQSGSEALVKLAQEKGMAWMIYCSPMPADQMEAMAKYDNFCGDLAEDDSVAAKNCAKAMYDAGCRNVAVCGLSKGLSEMMDVRAEVFIEEFTALGGSIIAEDYSMLAFPNAVSTFAAAHPEMDGIFSVILNESLFQAVTTEGLVGQIKLGGYDISDSSPDFYDNGTLVYSCTGQQATIVASFAALYNYLYDGTHLIEDRSAIAPRAWIEVYNSEDYANYDQYIRFSTCYSPEEIGYMIKGFNPEYTYADYEEMNLAFSIEDVVNRTVG